MQIRLNEYKGRLRDAGRRVSNDDIAKATGIGISTIDKIATGLLKELRVEYLDALANYFAAQLGLPVEQIDLVAPEPIALPLRLNIRPDRHGKRVGQPSEESPAPEPIPPANTVRARNQSALLPPKDTTNHPATLRRKATARMF